MGKRYVSVGGTTYEVEATKTEGEFLVKRIIGYWNGQPLTPGTMLAAPPPGMAAWLQDLDEPCPRAANDNRRARDPE